MDENIAFSSIFIILSMCLVSVSALQHFRKNAVCFPTFDKHCSHVSTTKTFLPGMDICVIPLMNTVLFLRADSGKWRRHL